MKRAESYLFTLPVRAGEPVDPDGRIELYRDWVRYSNETRRKTASEMFGPQPRLRVRVRGRLGKDNPFAKLIDFRGARDIPLLYAQRCDIYVETVA